MVLLSADWTFIHFVQSSPGLAKVKRILQDMRIIHARNLPVSVIMILKIDIDIYLSMLISDTILTLTGRLCFEHE